MHELVNALALKPFNNTRFDAMPLGTQKKFMLTAAFIGKPKVFITDEPSNGLDTQARDILASYFRSMGSTCVVLFASHDETFIQSAEATVLQFDDIAKGAQA